MTQRISVSKNNWHVIASDNPPIKSFAALILLQDELRNKDVDFNKNGWQVRVEFSRTFLRNVLEREGDLVCTYCDKPHLKIEEQGMFVPNHIKATIDHVVPVSKGGGTYEVENLVVACGTCNTRKDNMTLVEFLHRFNKGLKPNFKILQRFLNDDEKINTLARMNETPKKRVDKKYSTSEVNALVDDLLRQEFVDFTKDVGPFGWNKVRDWKEKNNLTKP
jgi:5-methylcytosine-specific restriction endonuclease McrA